MGRAHLYTKSTTFSIKARLREGLHTPPSHSRVATIIAIAIQTTPFSSFDPNLIGLHLTQVAGLHHQLIMHLLTVSARLVYPAPDCASLKAEHRNNSLYGAAVCYQVEHQRHRLSLGVAPVERRTSCMGEGLTTHLASIPTSTSTMNNDVALSHLPTCKAVRVRAEYLLRVCADVVQEFLLHKSSATGAMWLKHHLTLARKGDGTVA